MTSSRYALIGVTALLAASAQQGCTNSSVLPPTASIPPSSALPPNSIGNVGRRPQPPVLPSAGPKLGSNPWRPTAPARQWKYIVVHHSAGNSGSVDSIHEDHLKKKDKSGNPWLGIGYHFVIGNGKGMPDGEIEPTFRWRTQIQGAHAGSNDKDYNERGIGVCLIGNFENGPPSAAQRRSIRQLVQTLKNEYGIPTVNIVGHKDIRASSTECPGKLFPMHEVAGEDAPAMFGQQVPGVPVVRSTVNSGSLLR